MFIIADEDVGKFQNTVCDVLAGLASSHKRRIDQVISIGDGLDNVVVSGYWVVDTIRIDIRIKK